MNSRFLHILLVFLATTTQSSLGCAKSGSRSFDRRQPYFPSSATNPPPRSTIICPRKNDHQVLSPQLRRVSHPKRLMTSRYRVEYHLKSHRRDGLIEWIKGLLVVPFVLVRELPSTIDNVESQESVVKDRYASVFRDVEGLIDDHSISQSSCLED